MRCNELFGNNIGHVLFVAPTADPRPGTWLPLVYAGHKWLAFGVRLYLLSGPRTYDDNAWLRVAEQLRSHIHGLLKGHQELISQVINKPRIVNGAVDRCSHCFAVAILEDASAVIPERQCRLFYEYCGCQLSRWLSFKPSLHHRCRIWIVRPIHTQRRGGGVGGGERLRARNAGNSSARDAAN